MQDGIVELWMTSRGFERKGEAAADDIIKDNTAARVCTRVENLPRLHRWMRETSNCSNRITLPEVI